MYSEIRLRNPKKEWVATLEKIGKELREPTATGTLEKLVERYHRDQEHAAQLSRRNTELHRQLAYYVNNQEAIKATVQNFIKQSEASTREAKKMLAKFGTKKRRPTR